MRWLKRVSWAVLAVMLLLHSAFSASLAEGEGFTEGEGFAESGGGEGPTILLADVKGCPGDTVEVAISLRENPGVISVMFDLFYPRELEMTAISLETDLFSLSQSFTHTSSFQNPKRFSWGYDLAKEDLMGDGRLATVSFSIPEDAAVGQVYDLTVLYDHIRYAIFNVKSEEIAFAVRGGRVEVTDCLHRSLQRIDPQPPTATAAGNLAYYRCDDCGRLFLDVEATRETTAEEVTIPAVGDDPDGDSGSGDGNGDGDGDGEKNGGLLGDADGDGEVDAADRTYLARALAGWEGYPLPDAARCDLNGDGEVDAADRTYLARALAGWEGYALR